MLERYYDECRVPLTIYDFGDVIYPCYGVVTPTRDVALISLNEFYLNDVNVGVIKINKCDCIKLNAYCIQGFV